MVTGTWILWLSIQLGISSSQLTNSIIFQRGRYTTNQLGLATCSDTFPGFACGHVLFSHGEIPGNPPFADGILAIFVGGSSSKSKKDSHWGLTKKGWKIKASPVPWIDQQQILEVRRELRSYGYLFSSMWSQLELRIEFPNRMIGYQWYQSTNHHHFCKIVPIAEGNLPILVGKMVLDSHPPFSPETSLNTPKRTLWSMYSIYRTQMRTMVLEYSPIFTYIWAIFGVNVGRYSIHGASGGDKSTYLGPYNGAIFHIDWLVDINTVSFTNLNQLLQP